MNNEDRLTNDRPTFLDVNDHNFGCIQDRYVIFGSKVWFSGTAHSTGSFKFTSDLVAMTTKFETKLAITQLLWDISPRSLHLTGGFGGMAI